MKYIFGSLSVWTTVHLVVLSSLSLALVDTTLILSDDALCSVKCSNGVKPVQRPGYHPPSDGCGSQGLEVPTFVCPYMTGCCNTHDDCYNICGVSRAKCDSDLVACISDTSEQPLLVQLLCPVQTILMDLGVRLLGCQPFHRTQNNSCICPPN